jgi:DNA-binding transcriptional LysR family regulator
MISYDEIFTFIKVFETANYTSAAKLLNISQPSIRRHIQNLEQSLGKNLVQSMANNIEITEFGHKLYSCFKDKDHELSTILESLIEEDQDVAGELKVILPTCLNLNLILPYLPEFLQKYPKIKLKLNYKPKTFDFLNFGFDIAVTTERPAQESLIIRTLFSSKSGLYCTAKYASKYGIPSSVTEIKQHQMVGRLDANNSRTISLINKQTAEVFVVANDYSVALNDATSRMALLNSDQFIVRLENYELALNPQNDLIQILPEYEFSEDTYYLILPSKYKNSKTIAFCQFLNECIQRYERFIIAV